MLCSERNGKYGAGKVTGGTRADLAAPGLQEVGTGSTRWHVFWRHGVDNTSMKLDGPFFL